MSHVTSLLILPFSAARTNSTLSRRDSLPNLSWLGTLKVKCCFWTLATFLSGFYRNRWLEHWLYCPGESLSYVPLELNLLEKKIWLQLWLNFAGSNFKFPQNHSLIIFFMPRYSFDSIFTETTCTKLPLACLFCFKSKMDLDICSIHWVCLFGIRRK